MTELPESLVPGARQRVNAFSLFKNRTENRLRAGWRLLGYHLLLIVFLILLEEYATARIRPSLTQNGLWMLDAITGIIAFGGAAWLASKWLDRRPFQDLGFHLSRAWWNQLAFGAALGAILMALVFAVELALGYVRIIRTGYSAEPGTPLLWALLVMSIQYVGVAFTEEIWARGYMLRNLMEGLSTRHRRVTIMMAVLVSSSIFALPHGGNPNATTASVLLLVVFGILCAAGVVCTGELAIPMGLHLTWNFFQGNVFGFPVSGWALRGGTVFQIEQSGPEWFTGGAFGPEAGAAGLGAMLLGILLIYAWTIGRNQWRKNYSAQYRPAE